MTDGKGQTRTRIDWPALETRYVTGDETLKQVAQQTGVSERALASHSKAHGWPARRLEHRSQRAAEVQRRIAGRQASDEVKTIDLVKSIGRRWLTRFAQLVNADAVEYDVASFEKIARLTLLLEGTLPAESLDVRMRQLYGKSAEEMTDAELDAALADAVDEELRERSRTPSEG